MEKKNVVFLTVLAVATLLTAIVGTTFAWFSVSITNTSNVPTQTNIQTATLSLEYDDGSAVVTANKIVPGWSQTKTITVENKSNIAVQYRIDWTGVSNNFVAETDTTNGNASVNNFVYAINASTTDTSDTGFHNSYSTSTDVAMPTTSTATLVENVAIAAGKKHTYVITMKYNYGNYSQDVNQGKTFNGTFQLSATNTSAS